MILYNDPSEIHRLCGWAKNSNINKILDKSSLWMHAYRKILVPSHSSWSHANGPRAKYHVFQVKNLKFDVIVAGEDINRNKKYSRIMLLAPVCNFSQGFRDDFRKKTPIAPP